jgi:hypothetical protein
MKDCLDPKVQVKYDSFLSVDMLFDEVIKYLWCHDHMFTHVPHTLWFPRLISVENIRYTRGKLISFLTIKLLNSLLVR